MFRLYKILMLLSACALCQVACTNGVISADALAAASQKQLDVVQRLFRKTSTVEHVATFKGKGFSQIGSVGYSYNGITHKDDLQDKIAHVMKTAFASHQHDVAPLIKPRDKSGKLSIHDYLLASSTKGNFEIAYFNFIPTDRTMEYFDFTVIKVTGTMSLFPDTIIEIQTDESFLQKTSRSKVTYIPREVTLEDIDAMFTVMMQPVLDIKKQLYNSDHQT